MNKVQQLGGPDLDLKKNYSTCELTNLSINFEKLIYNNNHKKLLEFSLSDSASLKQAISSQAQKAMFSRKLDFCNSSLLCHLFDSLISPIANYGCEVWGHVKADDLEIVHCRFCKFALGVPSTATNL